jgi:glucans biosynthesis protein C
VAKRLHYVDWLRVLAVLLLFPFHTSRVFNYGEPFYVKSAYLSMLLSYTLGFINEWHMPLLFLLAGASSYFSLGKRSGRTFVRERFVRLGVPLVFGVLVLVPPQTYIGARFNAGYTGTYWQYLTSLDFLRWNIQNGGDYYGGFGLGQLWFILFLLVFSLIALPFLIWGRGRGAERIPAWARRLARPAWWLLPPAILFFAEAMPAFFGKEFVYDLAFFALGYVVIADDSFSESAEKRWPVALPLGAVLCGAWLLAGPWRDSLPDPSVQLAIANYLGMVGVWTILIGFLGVGRRYLDAPSGVLSYLAEASYPVYILHQTAIVLVAWVVVTWPVGLALQWIAVLGISVAITFALYEGVRRVGVLRWLFGMRPTAK